MHHKRTGIALASCALLLAACSTTPGPNQVTVTVTGENAATFTSSEPFSYSHAPGVQASIRAQGDAGDYSLTLDLATPLEPTTYTNSTTVALEPDTFRATLYTCDGPRCDGVALSSSGSLTLSRADTVLKGEMRVQLVTLDGATPYGEATASFTVPAPVSVP